MASMPDQKPDTVRLTIDGTTVAVRIPAGAPLTERAQVRVEVVRLYDEACLALGLPPRNPEDDH